MRVNSLSPVGALFLLVGMLVRPATVGAAEVFELANGARIEGVLLNPDETPRRQYLIGLSQGMRVAFPLESVRSVVPIRPVLREYERRRVDALDTVDGQLTLAGWCREQYLNEQADLHLERVLELDPDNATARAQLGHMRVGDRWTTRDSEMRAAGYIQSGGLWRTPQEMQILEQQQAYARAEAEWKTKIRTWRGWLDGQRAREAQQNLVTIDDPVAVGPLAELLRIEKNEKIRELYLSALRRIGTRDALREITYWSLEEPLDDLRLTCFEALREDAFAVDFFVSHLSSSDNLTINRAAYALKHLNSQRAVPALIRSLTTVHRQRVTVGDPNKMNATFGSSGTGFSAGKSEVIRQEQIRNQDVLDALCALSGVNFGFDADRWKAWWVEQRQLRHFNPRRG